MRAPVLLVVLFIALTLCACGGGDSKDTPPAGGAETAANVPATDAGSPEYLQSVRTWRKERLDRLTSDTGWLTIAGFAWLKEGENTLGCAPGNDIVLPEGACPERAGVLIMNGPSDARSFEISPAEGAEMELDGEPFRGGAVSAGDVLQLGRLQLWIIERGGNHAVRLRDPESPLRGTFTKIDYYPIRESHRVTGRLEPLDPPKHILVHNVMGYVDSIQAPGSVEFTLEGDSLSLIPIIQDPSDSTTLFFVFEDKTTGIETYGGGRYLYADLQPDGTVVLDFNKAYNPPCAFNEFTTCSLPFEENRLSTALRAGEKAYTGKGN